MSREQYLDPQQKVSHIEQIIQANPETAGLLAYEYFRSDAASQFDAYVSGEQTDLLLEYSELNETTITSFKEPMLEALTTLMPGETNPKSEALYRAVEYRYTELFMLDMARIMNSAEYSPDERAEAEEQFRIVNEALYGAPQQDAFSAIAHKDVVPYIQSHEDDSETTSQLKSELKELLGEISETDYQVFRPEAETVDRLSVIVHERFDSLVDHIDADSTYGVDGMLASIDTMLEKIGAKEFGWTTEIIEKSSTLSVAAHKKKVYVGVNKKPISGKKLKEVGLHEVGVHLGRSISAESAGWASAQYGQDGYLEFEESLATAMEDAYAGKSAPHGEQYYLIAGLAYGLDNAPARDLKEVHEILWRLKALKSGELTDEAMQNAKTTTLGSAIRMFRGTTGKQKGTVFLKDLSYYTGQEKVWNELEQVRTQEDLDKLLGGKLDNSRADHKLIADDIVARNKA